MNVNGGRYFTGHDLVERGTYNLLLDDSTFYDALAESRESSDDLFKGTFTEGFPWEVLEVIQGIVYFRFCNCPQVYPPLVGISAPFALTRGDLWCTFRTFRSLHCIGHLQV